MSNPCEIACQKLSFTAEEKLEYEALKNRIFGKLIKSDDLYDGYSFIFSGEDTSILENIARWITLELKCCPFLRMTIKINHDKHLILELTGPKEFKKFILHELGL